MIEAPDDSKRDIWVLGFRDSDERPEKALGRVFGIDSVRARRLIASMPAVVKREVTTKQAEPIVAALRKIGARVALVPTGASRPPGRSISSQPPPTERTPPEPPPKPEASAAPSSLGLGDIESAGIDFGPSGPPSSGSHPPVRDSLPYPRGSSMPPTEPAKVSVAPPEPEPEPEPAPKPVTFLEPRAIPEEPPEPPKRNGWAPRLLALLATAVGVAGLFFATGLGGSVFGDTPDAVGAAAAGGAIAMLLFGLQAAVAAFAFDAALLKGGALALALVGGGAVGATGYLLHRVDPAEVARQRRAATMAAIREGRLPEARVFLTEPQAQLQGMDRGTASQWVDALYAAGARQVYVVVDYAEDPHLATGVALSLPVTQTRRAAVASTVRRQVSQAPADDGEWWLIPFR